MNRIWYLVSRKKGFKKHGAIRCTRYEIRTTRYENGDGRNCPLAFLDNKYIVDMVNLPMKEKKKEKDR